MPGDLSGTDLAIQAYWSTEAGAVGLEDLGVKPDHALKHGNQHVRLIMAQKFDMPELTQVAIPAVSKRDNMREHMNCPIRLPSNIVKEAYKDTADGGDGGDDPFMQLRVMREHPVVRRALGEGVLASKIAVSSLYWDGVAYTKKDTFVAFYFNLLRTNKIHLICLVRKNDLCGCGCRGWCSFYPILVAIASDLRDNEVVAGVPIACLFSKADWPAYTDIAGLRQWYRRESC